LFGPEFFNKYFSLFGEVKNSSRFALLFYFFFFLRRFIYATMIVYAWLSMLAECIIFLLTCLLMFAYFLIFRPYKSWLMNCLNLLNEGLLIINAIMFFFYWENPNQTFSFYSGYVLIFLLFLVITINILVMMIL